MEGSLITNKNEAVSVSIPYKYIIYKKKKDLYEYQFEYIYKLDSSTQHTTNRCLFVKPFLINDSGKCYILICLIDDMVFIALS